MGLPLKAKFAPTETRQDEQCDSESHNNKRNCLLPIHLCKIVESGHFAIDYFPAPHPYPAACGVPSPFSFGPFPSLRRLTAAELSQRGNRHRQPPAATLPEVSDSGRPELVKSIAPEVLSINTRQ
jgi:hypothetical protein